MNPGNADPAKPLQIIDLRSVSVLKVTWWQSGADTLVDLDSRFGKVLRLVGVTASQITLSNFLTVGQDKQAVIKSYLADWTDQTQVEASVVPPSDRMTHEGNSVIYLSSPIVTNLRNKAIRAASSEVLLVRLDTAGPQIQLVNGFNPSNPMHKIDVTGFEVRQLSDVGFEQLGIDTKVNFPNGQSLILRDVLAQDLSDASFSGWAAPDAFQVVIPNSRLSNPVVRGFDPSDRTFRLDLSGFMKLADFSELTLTAVGNDTQIAFRNTSKLVTLSGVSPSQITPASIIGPDSTTSTTTGGAGVVSGTSSYSTLFGGAGSDQLIAMPVADSLGSGNKDASNYLVTHTTTASGSPNHATQDSNAVAGVLSGIGDRAAVTMKGIAELGKTHDSARTFTDVIVNGAEEMLRTHIDLLNIPDKYAAQVRLAKNILKGSSVALKYFGMATDIVERYESMKAELVRLGRSEQTADEVAALDALGRLTVKGYVTGDFVALGAESGGELGLSIGAWFSEIPLVPVVTTAGGTILGAAVGAMAVDATMQVIDHSQISEWYHQQMLQLAERRDGITSGGQGVTAFAEYESRDQLSDTEQSVFDKIPVGGSGRAGNSIIAKTRFGGETYAERWDPGALPPTFGEGADPATLPPPSTSDLDTENGANFTYANGQFYKWDGAQFTRVVGGVLNDPDFTQDNVRYVEDAGEVVTSAAIQGVFAIGDVIESSVKQWTASLTSTSEHNGVANAASSAAGTFIAQFALTGDFDAAIKQASSSAIRSAGNELMGIVKENIRTTILGLPATQAVPRDVAAGLSDRLFSAFEGQFVTTLGFSIGQQLLTHGFDDSFASQIAVNTAIGLAVDTTITYVAESISFPVASNLAGFTVVNPVLAAVTIIVTELLQRAFP
ncbi:MAG: hypothetical protein NT069_20100, partial [Planctomycetota bacterium]|nr:hypothetical protein [Planctomycetota bacterium]